MVSLDSPDKWKVNHGAIQDFVEMRATEEERSLLMDSCVVNVKEEKTDTGSGSKFVNENINTKDEKTKDERYWKKRVEIDNDDDDDDNDNDNDNKNDKRER